VKLNLEGYSPTNLQYLMQGDTRQDEAEDAIRFQSWKSCLGMCPLTIITMCPCLYNHVNRNVIIWHFSRSQRSPRHSFHGRGAGFGRCTAFGQRQFRGQRVWRGGGQRWDRIGVGGSAAGHHVPVAFPWHHH